jgi:3-isopropylmalate/(R)-2-methylmalate dehydratase large subunit
MRPQTISEKILSTHAGYAVYQDELAIVRVDGVMATDTTAPMAIKAFEAMNGKKVWDARKMALIIDHAAPAPNEKIANLHTFMRQFAQNQGINLFDIGEGICHQVMMEQGYARPGQIFVGADSHTPTLGALNCFATGVGSTDLAAVMLTGKIWLKVPKSIRLELKGKLGKGITAKDLILFITKQLTISGATYQAIEYTGEAIENFTVASRMTLANMSAEMGAKTGIVHPKGLELPYDFEAIYPDEGAKYAQTFTFDVSSLRPQISLPESPDNVVDIEMIKGKKIDSAFVGTCTNGRLEDLQIVAKVLKGKKINPNVRFLVVPASKQVFLAAMLDGTAQILLEAGVSFGTPSCGPCVGAHAGVPGDGETVISSANRNFRGRMGNPKSQIYLASPATVAASALAGEITEANEYLNEGF